MKTLREELQSISAHTESNLQEAVAFLTASQIGGKKFLTAEEIAKKICLKASRYGYEDSIDVMPCVQILADFTVHYPEFESSIAETYIEWKELCFKFGEVDVKNSPIDLSEIKTAVEEYYDIN